MGPTDPTVSKVNKKYYVLLIHFQQNSFSSIYILISYA